MLLTIAHRKIPLAFLALALNLPLTRDLFESSDSDYYIYLVYIKQGVNTLLCFIVTLIMTVRGHGHPGGNLLLSGGRRRLGFEPPQCRLKGPSSSSLPDEALDPECQGPSGGGEPSAPRSKTAEKGPGAQLP
jgi:hypothetical protein